MLSLYLHARLPEAALSPTLEAAVVEDKGLIERCIAGDARAQRTFIERHKGFVYRVALKVTAERHTAEDLAQEAFIKILDRLDSFRGDKPVETWLYRVTVNHCLDYLRRNPAKRRHLPLESAPEAPTDDEASAESALLASELQSAVAAALATLPEKYRIVYLLHHWEDQTYEEIAQAEHTSVSAIKMRFARGRIMLVEKLKYWVERRR